MPLFWNNNFNQRANFQQGYFNGQMQNNIHNNFSNNMTIRNNGSLFSRLLLNRQQNFSQFQNNIQMPINQNGNLQNISNPINQPFMPNNQLQQLPQQLSQPIQNQPNQAIINQPQMISDNSGISFKPLTEDDINKINEEIQENIEKNKKQEFFSNDKEDISVYLKEFIQDENNGNIFYNSLSNNCSNEYYRNRLKRIGDDCNTEKNSLINYYKKLKNENFEPQILQINTNIPLRQGLFLAIEEEMKSYDKICNMLNKLSYEDAKEFYKMAFKKLSRINSIQYMSMDTNF